MYKCIFPCGPENSTPRDQASARVEPSEVQSLSTEIDLHGLSIVTLPTHIAEICGDDESAQKPHGTTSKS